MAAPPPPPSGYPDAPAPSAARRRAPRGTTLRELAADVWADWSARAPLRCALSFCFAASPWTCARLAAATRLTPPAVLVTQARVARCRSRSAPQRASLPSCNLPSWRAHDGAASDEKTSVLCVRVQQLTRLLSLLCSVHGRDAGGALRAATRRKLQRDDHGRAAADGSGGQHWCHACACHGGGQRHRHAAAVAWCSARRGGASCERQLRRRARF